MRPLLWLAIVFAFLAAACRGDSSPSPSSPSPTATATLATGAPTPEPSFSQKASETEIEAKLNALESQVTAELIRGDGSPSCLAELLAELHLVKAGETACARADLDGDGEDEYAVRFFLQDIAEYWYGTVAVFDPTTGYQPVFRIHDLSEDEPIVLAEPSIFGAQDFNGDGRSELAVTSRNCGAHTCSIGLYIAGWEDGAYVSLISDPGSPRSQSVSLYETSDQIKFADSNGDGLRDLVARTGVVNSVGAGLQRPATKTYLWDGRRYTFANLIWDSSNLRYFRVRDADEAFAAGNYDSAIALYQQAISGEGLEDVQYFGSREELMAYSQFRIGLVDLQLGHVGTASDAIEAAISRYPVTVHGQAAVKFRDASHLTAVSAGDEPAGCAAVEAYLASNLDRFKQVWSYGYANPEVKPESVCPF